MRDITYITSSLLARFAMLPRIIVAFARALLLAVMTGMRHLCKKGNQFWGKGYL
jgi:hypothetical protein